MEILPSVVILVGAIALVDLLLHLGTAIGTLVSYDGIRFLALHLAFIVAAVLLVYRERQRRRERNGDK